MIEASSDGRPVTGTVGWQKWRGDFGVREGGAGLRSSEERPPKPRKDITKEIVLTIWEGQRKREQVKVSGKIHKKNKWMMESKEYDVFIKKKSSDE